MKVGEAGDKLAKELSPRDAFAFHSGAEARCGSHPCMWAFLDSDGVRKVEVVAKGVRRTFPLDQLDKAFEWYVHALKENGYLKGPGDWEEMEER